MSTITKRRNRDRSTSYVAQVRVRPFKPVAKAFGSRDEADTWAAALEKSLRSDRQAGALRPDVARLSIAALVREYLADDAATSLRSYRDTQDRLAWWVNHFGNERVRDLGVLRLREARDRLKPGRAPATVNRYLAAMRSCWNWGRSAGLVPQDRPWPTRLMLAEPSGRVRFLADSELTALLNAARGYSPVIYAAIVLSLATGVRRGEMLRLKWSDVDLDGHPRLRVLEAKNKTARAIHLPAAAVAALKALRRESVVGQQAVFLYGDGSPLTGTTLEKPWRDVRRTARLRDFRWHDLRHSCASYLAQNGATLLEIGRVLGHKSQQVTMRYAHLADGAPVTGHAQLDAKLRGAT